MFLNMDHNAYHLLQVFLKLNSMMAAKENSKNLSNFYCTLTSIVRINCQHLLTCSEVNDFSLTRFKLPVVVKVL